jgi:aspartate aminotransferase
MTEAVSRRIAEVYQTGSAIRKMFDRGMELKAIHGAENVADLSIGNPDFPPPAAFHRALREAALHPGPHCYMPNGGYPHVRQAVADHLSDRGFFESVESRHVVMTTGAAGALNVTLKTILNPGDEVIVPRPFFVEYRYYIDNHAGTMVLVDPDDRFGLDLASIDAAISPRTRAVLLNSPNNPTGRVYDEESLRLLSELLQRREREFGRPIFVISDEPYRDVLFGDTKFVSPASIHPNSFMCYSWSKAFSISGERIGYVAVNPALATNDWDMLCGSLAMANRFLGFVNAPAMMQRIIAASLEAEIDISHYVKKRDRICRVLAELGYDFLAPEGAFYVFARTPDGEEDFLHRATENLLLVVPGSAFGLGGYFRICFACSEAVLDLACEKLALLAPASIG